MQTMKTAEKLRMHLAATDPMTRLRLFAIAMHGDGEQVTQDTTPDADGHQPEPVIQRIGRPPRETSPAANLPHFVASLDILIENAKAAAADIANQNPGAPSTPDPIIFVLESLAALWRQYRPEPVNHSVNNGSFRDFAKRALMTPPMKAEESQIDTALRRYLEKAV